MDKKSIELTLKAFKTIYQSTSPYREDGTCTLSDESVELSNKAIKALEEALAKQEQGEPVAYRSRMRNRDGQVITGWVVHLETTENPDPRVEIEPLYTTPQPAQKPWAGLTEQDRKNIHAMWVETDELTDEQDVINIVENWLKEKNT